MTSEELIQKLEEIKERKERVNDSDQQLYTQLAFLQRELDRKEVVEDSKYEEMLENIRKTNDQVSVEQFLRDHISQSEYDREITDIEELMIEIDRKMNDEQNRSFSNEQNKNTLRQRAHRLREELSNIQEYYRTNFPNAGQTIQSLNFDNMSDEEIVTLYDRISFGIDAEKFQEMRNFKVRRKTQNLSNSDSSSSNAKNQDNVDTNNRNNNRDSNNKEYNEIERRMKDFQTAVTKMNEHLEEIKAKLVLEDSLELNFNDAIRGLDTELKELSDEAGSLIEEIDSFKEKYKNADFSLDYKQIEKEIQNLKSKIKNVKLHHIAKWNARVDETNKLIDELKSMTDLDQEIQNIVDGLSHLDRCSNIRQWNSKYLDNIDYDKLIETNRRLVDIKSKLSNKSNDSIVSDLDRDIQYIENEIDRISNELQLEITNDDLPRITDSILTTADKINEFGIKLENNKDEITEEEYNIYLERLNDAQANLTDLQNQLESIKATNGKKTEKNNDYDDLLNKLEFFQKEVEQLAFTIEALRGQVKEGTLEFFENNLNTLSARLDDIEKEVEEKHVNGNLQENQYNNLKNKITEIRNKIETLKEKIKDPEMIADVDVFSFLNGRIDGVEKALKTLYKDLDTSDNSIKNKGARKEIDKIITRLEEEIKDIEKQLEKYKEEDSEKYKATKERLDNAKDRLQKVSKKYRSKCPLLVKAIKSAKDFYKKHKKIILIAAGLAAFGLVSSHVLIPAIMHGNIMIGYTSPALRGFAKLSNNVLGGIIGATEHVHGAWTLSNGVTINPSVAATSLLKGLAISGIGNTMLVAPVVIAIKKLIEKMKKHELKDKLSEFKEEKSKEKEQSEKSKKTKKPKKEKDKNYRKTSEYYAKLWKDFIKSEQSLDEYCEENELSENDKIVLNIYLNSQEERNSKKGGKRYYG